MDMDRFVVTVCAPTLAGIKVAGLVCIEDTAEYQKKVQQYNDKFNAMGLYFLTIGQCKNRNLLYIYRKEEMQDVLKDLRVLQFLSAYGYDTHSLEDCILHLQERFLVNEGIPHELGVFLGYPLEDVEGFIRYGGAQAKCCGEWQVYGDEQLAKRLFAEYDSCRNCFVAMYNRGFSIDKLVVA